MVFVATKLKIRQFFSCALHYRSLPNVAESAMGRLLPSVGARGESHGSCVHGRQVVAFATRSDGGPGLTAMNAAHAQRFETGFRHPRHRPGAVDRHRYTPRWVEQRPTMANETAIPRAGMLATVRNRRGVVATVEPFDGETGRLHLVHLEYTDDHAPAEERLLWELEPQRHLLEPNALPDPAHAGGPMPAEDFDALLRAARWTALSP